MVASLTTAGRLAAVTPVADYSSDSSFSSDDDGLPLTRRAVIAPAPPPPPPPRDDTSSSGSSTPQQRNSTSLSRATSSQDLMQEELRSVLTMFREKRPNLGIVKTPEVFIYQTSSPKEVQQWLRAKNFSDKVCKQLNGFSGNDLFGQSKKELVDRCGQQEGTRLDSQITVQRNVSGYATVRSTELRAILAKAREKVEEKPDPKPVKHSPSPATSAPAPAKKTAPAKHARHSVLPDYDSSDSDRSNRPLPSDGGLADMIKRTTLKPVKRTNIPLQQSK